MTACLLYDKIHKNQAENLLHLMLYFSLYTYITKKFLMDFHGNAIIHIIYTGKNCSKMLLTT